MASTPQPRSRATSQSVIAGKTAAANATAANTVAAKTVAANTAMTANTTNISQVQNASLQKRLYLEGSEALGQVVSQRHLIKEEIRRRTEEIAETVLGHSRVMKSRNFTSTTATDLQHMAELYDVMFFDSRLLALARMHKMSFRWSSRMTSAGGKTIRSIHRRRGATRKEVSYEIALSATLLFQTFGDLDRPIRVTGHACANRMDAMQRILEHELIHLAEMLVWDDSNCAACRFQTIAHRMFGHTEHKHELVTQHERASKKYNIRVGSMVTFEFEGQRHIGKVNRITRRVTVLVPDPAGQKYDDGKCYRKFYVPLSQLRPT